MSLDLVLLAHVAGAVVWMGGDAALALIGVRLRRSRDLAPIHGYARTVSFVGVRVLTPAALVVLVSGLWLVLVSDEWTFAQPWVLLGLAALLLAVLLGAAFLRRGASQLELALGSRVPDRVAVERALDRLLLGCVSVQSPCMVGLCEVGTAQLGSQRRRHEVRPSGRVGRWQQPA